VLKWILEIQLLLSFFGSWNMKRIAIDLDSTAWNLIGVSIPLYKKKYTFQTKYIKN